MLIVQISDTHIAGRNKKAYGIAPVAENLNHCIEHINQLEPKPDVVLVTGDICNSGTTEEYEQAKYLLDKLNTPYFVITGNHDSREYILSTFETKHCSSENGFVNYVVDDFVLRLIASDSAVAGHAGGEMCETRASWLETQLNKEPDKPTLLFMHHPPLKLGVVETDVDGFVGANRLGEIVQKHANIERILCGHIHLPAFTRWHGTIVSTAPSIGMSLVLDLTKQNESLFTLGSPAYQIHHWTPEKNLVSHTVTVKDESEIFSFKDINLPS